MNGAVKAMGAFEARRTLEALDVSPLAAGVRRRKRLYQLETSLDLLLFNTGAPVGRFQHHLDRLRPQWPELDQAAGMRSRSMDSTADSHVLTTCDTTTRSRDGTFRPATRKSDIDTFTILSFLDTGIFPWNREGMGPEAEDREMREFWNRHVVTDSCEKHLAVLKDTSDFGANALLRYLYLHGEIPPHLGSAQSSPPWRSSGKVERNPNFPDWVQAEIEQALLDFKYWMDEPFKAMDQPDVLLGDLLAPIMAEGSGFKQKRRQYDIPVNEEMTYWSENHQILFATAEYLAGQWMPAARFPRGEMPGQQHVDRAMVRIRRWLAHRLRFGFSEFNSPGYYGEDVAALVNLIDFASEADQDIREAAAMVLDLLIFDLARFSVRGQLGGASGRAYFEHKSCLWEQPVGDLIEILFGSRKGVFVGGVSAHAFASCRRYTPPDVLIAIGQDTPAMGIDRSRVSLNFGEARERYKIGSSTDDDVVFWWGRGAFFGEEITEHSFRVAKKFKLTATNPFAPAFNSIVSGMFMGAGLAEYLGAMAAAGPWAAVLIPIIGNPFQSASKMKKAVLHLLAEGSHLRRTNLYTYRNRTSMLSSAQNFNAGLFNAQAQVCQATLPNGVTVFTNKPPQLGDKLKAALMTAGISGGLGAAGALGGIGGGIGAGLASGAVGKAFGHDGPNEWTGSSALPRVVQRLGSAIIAYKPDRILVELFGDVTHAFFPTERMKHFWSGPSSNSNIDDGRWYFGQAVDVDGAEGYVAVYSAQTPKLIQSGEWANRELRATGNRNIFIIQIGSEDEFRNYGDFCKRVQSARIHVNGLNWPLSDFQCSYDIPNGRRLELHYEDNAVRYHGSSFSDDLFPRFENAYIECDRKPARERWGVMEAPHADIPVGRVLWDQYQYTIEHKGLRLIHDFRDLKSRAPKARPRFKRRVSGGRAECASASTPIERMRLRIAGASVQWAPVKADLYFDIGPVAWRLTRILFAESGREGAGDYDLDLRKLPLTVEDLVWLRLRLVALSGLDSGSAWTASWVSNSIELLIDGEVFESLNPQPIEPRADSVLVTQFRYGLDSDLLAWTLPMEPAPPVGAAEPLDPELSVPPFRSPTSALPGSGPPLPFRVRVRGRVESTPVNPTGEQWLFDLRAESLQAEENGREYVFDRAWSDDVPTDVPHNRFLRVRYPHGLTRLLARSRWEGAPVPTKGQRVEIDGEVLFHLDGWYELVPHDREGIRLVG